MEERILEYLNTISRGIIVFTRKNAIDIIDIVQKRQVISEYSIELYKYSMMENAYKTKPERTVHKAKQVFEEILTIARQCTTVKELYRYVFKSEDATEVIEIANGDLI